MVLMYSTGTCTKGSAWSTHTVVPLNPWSWISCRQRSESSPSTLRCRNRKSWLNIAQRSGVNFVALTFSPSSIATEIGA